MKLSKTLLFVVGLSLASCVKKLKVNDQLYQAMSQDTQRAVDVLERKYNEHSLPYSAAAASSFIGAVNDLAKIGVNRNDLLEAFKSCEDTNLHEAIKTELEKYQNCDAFGE